MGEDDRALAQLKQRPRVGSLPEREAPKPLMDGRESSDIESGDAEGARLRSRSVRATTGCNQSLCEPALHRVRFDISMTNAIRQVSQRGEGAEARGVERDRDPDVAREVFPEAVVPAPDVLYRNRSGIGEWIAGIRRSTRTWRRAIAIGFTRSNRLV